MYKIVKAVCFLALFFIATSVVAETITLPGLIRDVWPCKSHSQCGKGVPATCDRSKCHPDFEYQIGTEKGIVHEQLGSDRKPVFKGGNRYTVNSAAAFHTWYNTEKGWNIPIPLNLTLSNSNCQGSGCLDTVFTYNNSAFWPINGKGFGNYQDNKNFHFTFELHTRFTYQGGEKFHFTGDDDLFVFINEKLVIDLGGVHEAQSATVELDALDLELGESYPFDLFFAERHTTQSNFHCSTSIEITCPKEDHCGVCLGDGQSCCDCDDNNICTTDSCDIDNGNCINEPIVCGDGGNKCVVPSCDPQVGCTTTPLDCDDNDKCTTDSCNTKTGCSHIRIPCDDNNKCTIDSCNPSTGKCVFVDVDCDDNDECTIDSCDSSSGTCSHTTRNCDDGDACTEDSCHPTEGCQNVPISCNDGNDCTADSCDKDSGCSNIPIECKAENACHNATCNPSGGCQSEPLVCDDLNPCTIDSCNDVTGCRHTQKLCDDSNPCTADSCDEQTGECVYEQIYEDCTLCDFVNCTSDDLCLISTCDPSSGNCTVSEMNCDDSNPCTDDRCQDGVCFNDPIVCEESQDKCNPLHCNRQSGKCEVNQVICNDNNLCTNDVCNNATGSCSYPRVDCSADDKCFPQTCNTQTGKCDVHKVDCDDRNLCTADSCNSTTGECSFSPVFCETTDACFPSSCNGTTGTCQTTPVECSDGNECTEDLCQDGECIFTPIDCDDGDACTIDTCDPKEGCIFTPVDVSTHCNDNNACTNDTCVSSSGCVHETIPLPKLDNLCLSQYCDRRFGIIVSDIPCRPTDRCTCDPTRGCVCSDPNFFGDLNTEQAAGLGAGIIAVIVLGAAAGVAGLLIGSKKGYDWYHSSQGAKQTVVEDNPLYEANNSTVENPLFEEP